MNLSAGPPGDYLVRSDQIERCELVIEDKCDLHSVPLSVGIEALTAGTGAVTGHGDANSALAGSSGRNAVRSLHLFKPLPALPSGRLRRILGRGMGGAGRRPAGWRRRRRGSPFAGSRGLPGLFRAWGIVRFGSGFPWPWFSSCEGGWAAGSASARQPAELAESDEKAGGSPGRDDQQVAAGEPEPGGVRVVGGEQRVGQVADGEDCPDVGQPVRQYRDGDEHAGDEVQRQRERHGGRQRGILVADERGERVTK